MKIKEDSFSETRLILQQQLFWRYFLLQMQL